MAKRPMVNPTTAVPEAPMSGLANLMAMKGRDNDSMLVHLSPNEVNSLNKISGNTMTINPDTGLPEGRSRFLDAILPAIASVAVGVATGGASIPIQMAAQGAVGYGTAKLQGKSDDEALASGGLNAVTAGLFGGTGTDAAKEVINPAVSKDIAGTLMTDAVKAGPSTLNKIGYDTLNQGIKGGNVSDIFSTLASDSRSYSEMAKRAFQKDGFKALLDPAVVVGGAGQIGKQGVQTALVNQMSDDANRPPPVQEDFSNPIDIYSTPFTQTSMGPFNQQQVADNFISGNSGPYGMNFLNQAYGQEGGQVEEMNQGGLTQFNSIMGNPALQLQNPNPPMQMAGGGSFSPQMGPRGSSQGGKGSGAFSEMLNNPEVLAMLQGSGAPQDTKSYDVLASIGANPVQAMAGGGMTGAGQGQASIMQALQPMLQVANQQAQEAVQQPVQMKIGGDLSNYVPGLMGLNASALASLYNKVTGKKKDSQTTPNITNNYYGTGPDGQPMLMDGPPQQIPLGRPIQMAGGGEIVAGLRAIADNRAFEGRVKGQGDGMSDDIPFNIEGEQPALLARDEYVIPADVVAMVGNGSSDAGADHIDQAIAGIRQAKYGRDQQPRETEGLGGLLG